MNKRNLRKNTHGRKDGIRDLEGKQLKKICFHWQGHRPGVCSKSMRV